jgi:hypothetical protein
LNQEEVDKMHLLLYLVCILLGDMVLLTNIIFPGLTAANTLLNLISVLNLIGLITLNYQIFTNKTK